MVLRSLFLILTLSFNTFFVPETVLANVRPHCNELLTVLVVDGYSSGKFLAPELRLQGADRVIHAHANLEPITSMKASFIAKNFDADYRFDPKGDWETLVRWVEHYRPSVIIPGSESGVLLADQLSAYFHKKLGTPTNGVSTARRQKFEMGEALRKKGVPSVFQLQSQSVDEILAWANTNKLWPGIVVLKPVLGAGTSGVFFCHNEAEVRTAYAKIYGQLNNFGVKNEIVLAQEYLDGLEYVGNTVSLNGKHVVTDIWVYIKREIPGAGAVYDYDMLLPYEGEIQKQLVDYTKRVLDALEIKTGWGHAEIKMTKRGPVLVEVGNRMMGSSMPRLVTEALGRGQIEVGVMAYLHPEKFMLLPDGYEMKKHAAVVTLGAHREGTRFSSRVLPSIEQFEGHKRTIVMFKDGESVPKMIDMATGLGQVEFVTDTAEALQKSIEAVRKLDREEAFAEKE